MDDECYFGVSVSRSRFPVPHPTPNNAHGLPETPVTTTHPGTCRPSPGASSMPLPLSRGLQSPPSSRPSDGSGGGGTAGSRSSCPHSPLGHFQEAVPAQSLDPIMAQGHQLGTTSCNLQTHQCHQATSSGTSRLSGSDGQLWAGGWGLPSPGPIPGAVSPARARAWVTSAGSRPNSHDPRHPRQQGTQEAWRTCWGVWLGHGSSEGTHLALRRWGCCAGVQRERPG